MKAKLLGTLITSIISANIAFAAPQTVSTGFQQNLTLPTDLQVKGFNGLADQTTLTALQTPDSLMNGNVVDTTDLQNFEVYSNYGGGVTVTATNNVNNNQSQTGPAVFVNTAGGPNIPYAINYTPCGGGATIDLTTCTGSTGCTIPAANANSTVCASTPGTGNYTFKQIGAELGAGTYSGGTNLTFSSGL